MNKDYSWCLHLIQFFNGINYLRKNSLSLSTRFFYLESGVFKDSCFCLQYGVFILEFIIFHLLFIRLLNVRYQRVNLCEKNIIKLRKKFTALLYHPLKIRICILLPLSSFSQDLPAFLVVR